MPNGPQFPLMVFYDGACGVCATEMDHYRKKDGDRGRLIFVDISAPGFDAESFGRSPEEFQRVMHVRDAAGHFFTGVDAFPVIWQALPQARYHVAGSLLNLPGVHWLATLGYGLFARLRKYLPRRKSDCAEGVCHPRHKP